MHSRAFYYALFQLTGFTIGAHTPGSLSASISTWETYPVLLDQVRDTTLTYQP